MTIIQKVKGQNKSNYWTVPRLLWQKTTAFRKEENALSPQSQFPVSKLKEKARRKEIYLQRRNHLSNKDLFWNYARILSFGSGKKIEKTLDRVYGRQTRLNWEIIIFFHRNNCFIRKVTDFLINPPSYTLSKQGAMSWSYRNLKIPTWFMKTKLLPNLNEKSCCLNNAMNSHELRKTSK